MNMSWRALCKIVGLALLVIGLTMIPSLIVAGIYQELPALLAFLYTIFWSAGVGIPMMYLGQDFEDDLRIRDGFLVVTLVWLIAAIMGAVPFWMSGAIPNFVDAFFESCSGFTTTGCSILTDIESLPKSILFWRSFTHWIGGMGILIFAIALMPSLGISGQNVIVSEAPGPTLDKLTPKISDTAKMLYSIYFLFTAIETVLLCLGGMSLFDSLIHTFGSVGTGGLSNYSDSVAHFDSAYIQIVITVFMILCGTNFNLFYLSYKQHWNYFKHDSEFKLYIGIIIAFSFLIMLNLRFSGVYDNLGESLRHSLFQVSSVITTTGYATTDFNLWPSFSKMLLLLLMFVGGCASSTGGGIKVIRILVLLKLIRRGIATSLHPRAVVNIRLNDTTIPSETVTNAANHAFLYLILLFSSTLLLSLDGFDIITNFTAAITCLGNIGPGFNLVGPMGGFSMFSGPAKLLCSFLMLAGRLELYTLMIILTPKFWRPNR